MIPVKSVMTTNVIFVRPETPIYEALDILSNKKISGVPVVNDQMEVVGILSEKDVLQLLIDKALDVKSTVDNYMTREVVSFTEEDDIVAICKFFIRSYIRRVPIVRDSKLVGIVSRRDIVNVILEAKSKMSPLRYV
ncbi:MAG: CBS domain-containing protein [Candidatus Omnitrophota bacterium]|nr:CBS domain-containing protein [Candidatus Omnitrophota bacterium]